jgi:hypothetical protein
MTCRSSHNRRLSTPLFCSTSRIVYNVHNWIPLQYFFYAWICYDDYDDDNDDHDDDDDDDDNDYDHDSDYDNDDNNNNNDKNND